MVAASGLAKSFSQGHVPALRDVSLTVMPGECVAITGRSGSGKSTLLYSLCGLIHPDEGEVRVGGTAPADPDAWTRLRADMIGIIFQDASLLPTLSAIENVELPMIGTGPKPRERRGRAAALLETVGVAECADRLPAQLSGGERQRVAVARSLANAPRLLLADEPTGELDTENADMIVKLLLDLSRKEGLTLLIVTHDPVVAARCDRQLVLVDGKGRLDPPISEHADEPRADTAAARPA